MRMNIVNFRNGLADPINRVMYQGERVVLERRGKAVAALVSMDDLQALEALEDAADVRAARKARKEGGEPIPLADIKAELGMTPAAPAGAAARLPSALRLRLEESSPKSKSNGRGRR